MIAGTYSCLDSLAKNTAKKSVVSTPRLNDEEDSLLGECRPINWWDECRALRLPAILPRQSTSADVKPTIHPMILTRKPFVNFEHVTQFVQHDGE